MQRKIFIILTLIVWPLSLFLNNTFSNFLNYLFPLFEPKFTVLPFLFVILYFKFQKPLLIIIAFCIFLFSINSFLGQTIVAKDYEKQQEVLQKQNLYNSIFLARLFHNKAKVIFDKFIQNSIVLIDPNNYFFGFAPRQILVDNQNLRKFPFLSIPFLLIGIFNIKKIKYKKILLTFLFASFINLSLLNNFDRNDFILWIPISFIIIHGINIFSNSSFKYKNLFFLTFVICSSIEIIRLFYY